MTFDPSDPCTHAGSCFCHWCSGGREDLPPEPMTDHDMERLLRETPHGDECPLCQCGTVERVNGEVKCRGECGSVTAISCARCDSELDGGGLCTDMTCPFFDRRQDDPKGWTGHPEPPRLSGERFRDLAKKEDGAIVSVGGLAMKMQDRIMLHAVVRADFPGIEVRNFDAIKSLHADHDEAFAEMMRLNNLAVHQKTGARYHVLPARWMLPAPVGVPRPDLVPVMEIQNLPDGVKAAIVSCADYDAFASLPSGLEIGTDTYGKTGWNSDRNVAYYRTDAVMGSAR